MLELTVGTLMVLVTAGSGIAALPWTDAELASSVRAYQWVGRLAARATRAVLRRPVPPRRLVPEPARAAV